MILAFVVAALSGLQLDPLDAVAAAPENHVVILENDRVRVLRVTVQPGETEAPHVHRWSSVMHIQSAQPLVDILYERGEDGLAEVRRTPLPPGPPPEALWFPPEGPHAIYNAGDGVFRAIRIELKSD